MRRLLADQVPRSLGTYLIRRIPFVPLIGSISETGIANHYDWRKCRNSNELQVMSETRELKKSEQRLAKLTLCRLQNENGTDAQPLSKPQGSWLRTKDLETENSQAIQAETDSTLAGPTGKTGKLGSSLTLGRRGNYTAWLGFRLKRTPAGASFAKALLVMGRD
ncbi:MAG: hypothetical protein WD872_14250 [Pirellulaceae bacterium]